MQIITKNGVESEYLDLLSRLPNDCLMEIFARLDHNDHDEVATLSRRMCTLSDGSRSRCAKILVFGLEILQERRRELHFTMRLPRQKIFLELKDCTRPWDKLKKRNEGDVKDYKSHYTSELQVISGSVDGCAKPGEIIDRAAAILSKFDFQSLEFYSMCIDDHFLTWFEQIARTSRTLNNFILMNCFFDDAIRSDGRERLLSSLSLARPITMCLVFCCDASFIDETFLRNYAKAVLFARLGIFNAGQSRSLLFASKGLGESLSQLGMFSMPRLVINTDWLLSPLLKRLRHKTEGTWHFRTTRNIDQREIDTAMGSDMKCSSNGNRHTIELADANFKLDLRFIQDNMVATMWNIEAVFQYA
ncbi:hypothetical protein PENTCL1PPCAC_24217 [Pristionchus entomophagus]|uniref:F-box domain-containing protein n=1 Tax=Pristionchus entomophagus TaxID=358040 RepID=A0AAV5U5X6_9BILA|nr:hypothetical protein PENTCL1PPCAC_24217 [Pristionchus entomophagus]